MNRSFNRPINAVRFRQRVQRTLNYAAWGLFAAALVVLLSPYFAATIFVASVIIGFVRSYSPSSAARLIDRHYHLKDRFLTTIALLRRKNRTPMEQLQIDNTAEHITAIRPRIVYPIRLPKMFWIAIGVFALNFVGTSIIHSRSQGNVETEIPVVLSEESTALLTEIVAKTEELAETHSDEPLLRELFGQMEVLAHRFETTVNTRETLMTLSEMEDAFQAALDAMQLERMDELLAELAKTLELADQTLPISRALEKEDYSLAASELRKLDAETLESLSQPERNAMAEHMQAIADNAEEQNQTSLQEAAQAMSDALKEGDGEASAAAADALADEVETHGIRMDIGKQLVNQMMELGMMKAECGMAMDGGDGIEKSDAPQDTWGMGAAGNPNEGQETQLEAQRQQEILTGMLGEEEEFLMETIEMQEISEERSLRQYREQFQHYERMSEAVLDTEPIPPGQRRVIRRYFESIRPSAE